MVAAGLQAVPADELDDWYGEPLPSAYLNALTVGCTVRVQLKNTNTNSWEKVYFKIIKIKDGTYWGEAQDTYRSQDYVGLPTGAEMTFNRRHILEIPQEKWWQPKSYIKAVSGLP